MPHFLLVVLAVAFVVVQPIALKSSPTLEDAQIENLKFLGLPVAEICGTSDGGDPHVHCESCLVELIALAGLLPAPAVQSRRTLDGARRDLATPIGRTTRSAHHIRAPPFV